MEFIKNDIEVRFSEEELETLIKAHQILDCFYDESPSKSTIHTYSEDDWLDNTVYGWDNIYDTILLLSHLTEDTVFLEINND